MNLFPVCIDFAVRTKYFLHCANTLSSLLTAFDHVNIFYQTVKCYNLIYKNLRSGLQPKRKIVIDVHKCF